MALRRAVKILVAAAAENFGWLGGAPSVFQRRWRWMIPAGVGGAIWRLGYTHCYNNHATTIPLFPIAPTNRH